jgi:hypothetical protein
VTHEFSAKALLGSVHFAHQDQVIGKRGSGQVVDGTIRIGKIAHDEKPREMKILEARKGDQLVARIDDAGAEVHRSQQCPQLHFASGLHGSGVEEASLRHHARYKTSVPVGSSCATAFMDCRKAASCEYITRRARPWFPSGLCSAMQCHGL